MRTTVNLPSGVHRRVRELAEQRHQPLSTVIADLTVRGLAALDEPVEVSTDSKTGFPVITFGRRITAGEVGGVPSPV
ncbi:MAG: hypothetical protein ACRDV8_09165 [Acidimicrobiales bacterium]